MGRYRIRNEYTDCDDNDEDDTVSSSYRYDTTNDWTASTICNNSIDCAQQQQQQHPLKRHPLEQQQSAIYNFSYNRSKNDTYDYDYIDTKDEKKNNSSLTRYYYTCTPSTGIDCNHESNTYDHLQLTDGRYVDTGTSSSVDINSTLLQQPPPQLPRQQANDDSSRLQQDSSFYYYLHHPHPHYRDLDFDHHHNYRYEQLQRRGRRWYSFLQSKYSVVFSISIVLIAYFYSQNKYWQHSDLTNPILPPGPPPPIPWMQWLQQQQYLPHSNYDPTASTTNAPMTDTSTNFDAGYPTDPYPAATPTSSSTTTRMVLWKEYIHVHVYQLLDSILALGLQTPYYILQFAIYNILDDIQQGSYRIIKQLEYRRRTSTVRLWRHQRHHDNYNKNSFWKYIRLLLKYIRCGDDYNENTTIATTGSTMTEDWNPIPIENDTSTAAAASCCSSNNMNDYQWIVPSPPRRYSNNNYSSSDTIMDTAATLQLLHDGTYYAIGQDLSMIESIRTVIHTWQLQQRHAVSHPAAANIEHLKPLIVLATGYPNTGKRQLAYNILQSWKMEQKRCNERNTNNNSFLLEIHGIDYQLQDYEKNDVDDMKINDSTTTTKTSFLPNQHHRRLYRKLMYLVESHYYRSIQNSKSDDNDYCATFDCFCCEDDTASSNNDNNNHQTKQQPRHMILITNIEDMDPYVLVHFLLQLQATTATGIGISIDYNDDDDVQYNNNNNNHNILTLLRLCSNTIIYLTTNQYGVPSIIQHVRKLLLSNSNDSDDKHGLSSSSSATTTTTTTTATTINTVGIISDIRDTLKKQYQKYVTANSYQHEKIWNTMTILPFVPITSISLRQLLRYRINIYHATTIRPLLRQHGTTSAMDVSSVHITDCAVDVILDDKNIEYIEWRRTINTKEDTSSSKVIQKIVLDGTNAIQDRNPIMTKLYTELHLAILTLREQQQFSFGSEKEQTSSSFVLLLDYDTSSFVSFRERASIQLCHTNTEDIKSSTKRNSNLCKTIWNFAL